MKGKRIGLLLGFALALMLSASSVLAQESTQEPPQGLTATFELTIDGQVPEGKIITLDTPTIADDPPRIFCSTSSGDDFPQCEDGNTYSVTVEGNPGNLLDYRHVIYNASGPFKFEAFASDTIRLEENTTVSVTYEGDDSGEPVEDVYTGEVFTGTDGPDQLSGSQGDDIILGLGAEDELSGGEGDDLIHGGSGEDYAVGGYGSDALHGGYGDDALHGQDGDDAVRGNAGGDLVDGGSGDDLVRGNDGDDYVTGYLGSDTLDGGGGDDYIYAADGDPDEVSGGPGNDLCVVDEGDEVTGCEEVRSG